MKRHFGVVITLGLGGLLVAAYARAFRAALRADRSDARARPEQEVQGARPLGDDRELQRSHRLAAGRHQRAPAQAESRPGRPGSEARGAARGARQAGGGPRAAREAPQGARHRRGRPGHPPRRALQGRRAGCAHRRASGRRLRRPARADRVPRARVRAGPGDHRARPRPQGGGEEAEGAAGRARAARRGCRERDPGPAQRARAGEEPAASARGTSSPAFATTAGRSFAGARQPDRARGRPARRSRPSRRASPRSSRGRRRPSSRDPGS